MSNSERNSHRRNNVSHRNSLVRGPDGSYGLVSTTPSAMNAAASATTSSGSGRRRKSRSPGSVTRPRTDSSTVTTAMGKKRKSAISLSSAATSSVHGPDDMIVDRGRKPKLKTKTHSRNSTENSTPAMEQQIPQLPTIPQRPSKKERSRSRGSRERGSKKFPLSESSAAVSELEKGFNSGVDAATSFTSAELLKLKKEMESLRKQAHENKKTIHKQSKVIDELRQKVTAGDKTIKEGEQTMQKLKVKSKKAEETLSNIEGNISCQICMETLMKPFALSPCGHVLCQGCLQEWFRKAPANDDDMYDDDDPDYLMYRLKSCPCCRANVRTRPVPVFIVKAIASALIKGKAATSTGVAPQTTPPPPETDPWAGLFPPTDEEGFGEDDDEDANSDDDDDDDDDDDEDEGDYDDWLTTVFAYGSDSDGEPYNGEYVTPQWEPPQVDIDPEDYEFEDLDEEDLNILRRGATLEMMDVYRMSYTHAEGLVATIDSSPEDETRVFLGWNIRLSADDDDGAEYIDFLFQDMLERPERWDITESDDGVKTCHRLVPEDDVVDYEDTDSDFWIGDNDDDVD